MSLLVRTVTIRFMPVYVVATDGSPASDAALGEALGLARETHAELAVITVWRALQGDFGLAYPSATALSEILDAERLHAEATLAEAAERAREAGVTARTRLTTGDPVERICAHAVEVDARLIAIGTRGHGTVTSLLLGSVSHGVIRQGACPVLVVHAAETDGGGPDDHTAAGRAAEAGSSR